MTKNTYILVGVTAVVVLAAAVVGVFGYKAYTEKHASKKTTDRYTLGKSTQQKNTNQDSSPSELNVNQLNTGDDLGQLDVTNNQQNSGSSADNSEKQTNPFDPSTYKQYDKYLKSESAMFAEVVKGTGAELTKGKKAAVYYKGWLTDGTLFDQTKAGKDGKLEPFVFEQGANQVIPGWQQGLEGMKVGGVRLVIIPPAVGYGEKGQAQIPGNAVLIFQVQLAAVE